MGIMLRDYALQSVQVEDKQNEAGISGDFDIFKMVFNVTEGKLGVTDVKLNYAELSYTGSPVASAIADGIVSTELTQWYSPYDLTKDGAAHTPTPNLTGAFACAPLCSHSRITP